MSLVSTEKRSRSLTHAEAGTARPTLASNRQSASKRSEDPGAPGIDNLSFTRSVKDRPSDTVARLRDWLDRHKQRRARRAGWAKTFIKTGLDALDAALPHGGLPNGAVTEIYSEAPGVGSLTLALRIAACARVNESEHTRNVRCDRASKLFSLSGRGQGEGEETLSGDSNRQSIRQSCRNNRQSLDPLIPSRTIVVLDTWGDFYPPAVAPFGIDPQSLIVIRDVNQRDAFWAVDQCLRCPAAAAVIAPLSRLDECESRRLQLAAESSGAIGLLLRPAPPRSRSFAAVRMFVEGVVFSSSLRPSVPSSPASPPSSLRRGVYPPRRVASSLCRITLLSVREGMPADPFVVDLHHATGACDIHSIPGDRSAAKIG